MKRGDRPEEFEPPQPKRGPGCSSSGIAGGSGSGSSGGGGSRGEGGDDNGKVCTDWTNRYDNNLEFKDLQFPPVEPTKDNLFEDICGDANLIIGEVESLVTSYRNKMNQESAIVTLLLFVIKVCCRKIPTLDELSNHDISEEDVMDCYLDTTKLLTYHTSSIKSKVTKITELHSLSEESQFADSIKSNVRLFFHQLVLKSVEEPVFDPSMLEQCMDYIIHLSREKNFRSITILMGFQLLESYIEAAKSASVETQQTSVSPKVSQLELMMLKLFQGVYQGICQLLPGFRSTRSDVVYRGTHQDYSIISTEVFQGCSTDYD